MNFQPGILEKTLCSGLISDGVVRVYVSPCTFLFDLKVTVRLDHAAVSQPIVFLYKLFLPLVSAPCANYHIYNE